MKIGNIWQALRNSAIAILRGEFLVRLRCDKYFLHIIYTFFLLWLMIWLGIKIENTMVRVEKNKETLTNLKIYHAQKTVQMVSFDRVSTVEQMLREAGSDVTLPDNPAVILEK